jgi:tRNA threonylcarbamoyladenosine biosynthesis protein TsaE
VSVSDTVVTRTPGETEAVGEGLGRTLAPGAVVALIGELGAGKTCFVQGLVRGLGVATRATSPTFVLINEYRGRVSVHHVDAYRIDTLTELLDLGLPELFGGEAVTVIEWADKLQSLLPSDAIVVRITGLGDEPRAIFIERPDASPASVWDSRH